VNDFEIVRRALEDLESYSGSKGVDFNMDEERAALDRIEAEMKRLETERSANEELGLWLVSEVRRLEQLYDLHTGGNECSFEVEVKRLREAERGWYERTNEVMHLKAEVERLRAELADREEMLRQENEERIEEVGALEAENKQLQTENEELTNRILSDEDERSWPDPRDYETKAHGKRDRCSRRVSR
jgi:chromosome segregation ATPase